jgi:hypothetical protein
MPRIGTFFFTKRSLVKSPRLGSTPRLTVSCTVTLTLTLNAQNCDSCINVPSSQTYGSQQKFLFPQ